MPKADGIDLENLRATLETTGWAMIRARIEQMLETDRLQCERPAQDWVTPYHQGKVAALRAVLAVPAILDEEIRTRGVV